MSAVSRRLSRANLFDLSASLIVYLADHTHQLQYVFFGSVIHNPQFCSCSHLTNFILSNNCRKHQHGLFVCYRDDTHRAAFLAAACL